MMRRTLLHLAPTLLSARPAHALRTPQYGIASFYAEHHHGKRMASGRPFDMWGANCAHRRLAMGTRCRVRNLRNGRTAEVVVLDRGPYIAGRILDVSRGTARALGFEAEGLAPVEVAVLP